MATRPANSGIRPTNWALITAGFAMFIAAVVIEIFPTDNNTQTNVAASMEPTIAAPAPLNF